MATPQRSIRVPDDVWQAATAKARERGESLSVQIVTFLRGYAGIERRRTPNDAGQPEG